MRIFYSRKTINSVNPNIYFELDKTNLGITFVLFPYDKISYDYDKKAVPFSQFPKKFHVTIYTIM